MAGTEPKHRDWIKLWIKESLLGTIREDLEPDERSCWYDFLLLAGNCRVPGIISANEDTAMPTKRIAAILNVEQSLVERCISKFEQSGRIQVSPQGVIHILNWEKYQYSDYDRVKKYRQKQQELATSSKPQGDKPQAPPAAQKKPDDFASYLEELRPQYSDLDIDNELVKFNLYWSEGKRKLQRPKLALKNWLDKAREIQPKKSPPPSKPPRRTYDDGIGGMPSWSD